MQPLTTEFNFSDEFCVARVGIYPNAQARVEQVIDLPALNTMAAEASARFTNGRGDLLIDFDHNSEDLDKSSIAAGWGTGARVAGDKLLLKARWTDVGRDALRNGRFRYCSPVFSRVEKLGGNRVRPIAISSVALTNCPVLRDIGPIANRLSESGRIMNRATDLTFQGERITNRRAADLFSALVREDQREHKRAFTDSWNHVRNRYSVLNALMRMPNTGEGVLLNRSVQPFQTADTAEQAKYWATVEKVADKVRARVSTPVRIARCASAEFWSVWDEAFAKARGDRGRTFDIIRDTRPEIFGNFVLNSPEAAQFL